MKQVRELFILLLRALACVQKQKKNKKHSFIVKHTMWSIVVRHVGDNGESTGRVGSWKVKGAEQRENIQFNFETAPAQSTNTKASLQPYPC